MKKLALIVDTTNGVITDFAWSPVELPEVVYGDTILVMARFLETLGYTKTALNLTGVTSLRCHLKKDRLTADDTTLTIATAYNEGYFPTHENLTLGRVTWILNLFTSEMLSALGSEPYVDVWLEFSMVDSTGLIPSTLGQLQIRVLPQIDDGAAGTPPPAGPTYSTAAEVAALVAARAPLAAIRHVFWPAGAAIPRTTAGAAPGTVELVTNDVMLDTYDFDTGSDEAVQFSGYLEHWNASTIKVKPVWTAASGSGTVSWSASARALANDDALDQAFGTAASSTDTLITANDEHVGPATAAITVAGTPANGQRLQVQILRDTSEDTLGVDACLIGIWIEYTEAAIEEAAW